GVGKAAATKSQSAWLAAMKSAIESNDRVPIYAKAMANYAINLPNLGAPKAAYLTITPNDELERGYNAGFANNRVAYIYKIHLSDATIVETETSVAEDIARFVTKPGVIPILLSVASLGFIVELYSPGFGVAGTMGVVALILFFYGHIIAGLAGIEALILLILGIILIIAEFFVVGGFLGGLGGLAVLGSLFMAGYDLTQMSISIGIAFVVAIIAAVFLFRSIGKNKGLFNKLVLQDRTTTGEGYISATDR